MFYEYLQFLQYFGVFPIVKEKPKVLLTKLPIESQILQIRKKEKKNHRKNIKSQVYFFLCQKINENNIFIITKHVMLIYFSSYKLFFIHIWYVLLIFLFQPHHVVEMFTENTKLVFTRLFLGKSDS